LSSNTSAGPWQGGEEVPAHHGHALCHAHFVQVGLCTSHGVRQVDQHAAQGRPGAQHFGQQLAVAAAQVHHHALVRQGGRACQVGRHQPRQLRHGAVEQVRGPGVALEVVEAPLPMLSLALALPGAHAAHQVGPDLPGLLRPPLRMCVQAQRCVMAQQLAFGRQLAVAIVFQN
jgi:hypothetical protein